MARKSAADKCGIMYCVHVHEVLLQGAMDDCLPSELGFSSFLIKWLVTNDTLGGHAVMLCIEDEWHVLVNNGELPDLISNVLI